MAIISPSALINEIRGKVGDVVFSRNASGPFVRAYVSPAQPVSPGQLNYLNVTDLLTSEWIGLTDAQKGQWNRFAKSHPYHDALGNKRTYSGYQLFLKTNWWLYNLSPSNLLESPVEYRKVLPFDYQVTFSSSTNMLLDVTNPNTINRFVLLQYSTNQYFASKKKFFRPDYRIIGVSNGFGDLLINRYSQFNTVFGGPLILGRRIGMWLRILDLDTGFITNSVYRDFIIDF